MADRPAQEVKELGIKSLIDGYQKNNRTTCTPEMVRKFEKLYTEQVMPRTNRKENKK